MRGKVTIVGGAGRVGATAAYALQLGQSCEDLVLVDAAAHAARGEALDLAHGRAASGGPRIRAGDYDAASGSDVIVVTAGLRRRADESRLQLTARNAALFREIVRTVQQVPLEPEAVLVVVTNPVDVLTYVAATELRWPTARTIGLGTALDTLRFRSLLAEKLDLDPTQLQGLILGEHGDSMVPIYSALRYDDRPLHGLPGYSQEVAREAFEEARTAGAQCIELKGGAGFAVGLAVRQVVGAILGDTGEALPVSTLQESGEFGGIAFSLPTRLRRAGAREVQMPPTISESEHRGLQRSAEVLREMTASLEPG